MLPAQQGEDNEPADFPMHGNDDDEPQDLSHIPFDDDDEAPPSAGPKDDQLRLSGIDDSHDRSAGVSIGGLLDDDDEEVGEAGQDGIIASERNESGKRKAAEVTPKAARRKRRKRRRVVIDNEESELSNAHIRSMLSDTSDIVRRQLHPADPYDEEEEEDGGGRLGGGKRPKSNVEWEERLTRPFFADDGQLPEKLLRLWTSNHYRALGQTCTYDLEEPGNEGGTNEAEDDGSVEQARRQDEGDEESNAELKDDGPVDQTGDDAEGPNGEDEPQDDGFVMMPDDEEEEAAVGVDDNVNFSNDRDSLASKHLWLSFVVMLSEFPTIGSDVFFSWISFFYHRS